MDDKFLIYLKKNLNFFIINFSSVLEFIIVNSF